MSAKPDAVEVRLARQWAQHYRACLRACERVIAQARKARKARKETR